jgi:hypothetical protein
MVNTNVQNLTLRVEYVRIGLIGYHFILHYVIVFQGFYTGFEENDVYNFDPSWESEHAMNKGGKFLGVMDKARIICFNGLYIKPWRHYGLAICGVYSVVSH